MTNKTIGAKIKSLRIQNELKQHELASHLSVTSSTISNWENDRRSPSIDELSRIADFFKVSLNMFAISNQFEFDLNEKSKNQSNTINQNIQLHYFGLNISNIQYILIYIFVIIVFISNLFNDVVQYFLFFFGMFSLIGTAVNLTILFVKNQKKHKKTLSIPNSYQVYYEHIDDASNLKKRHLYLKILVIVSFLLTISFIIFLSAFLFGNYPLWIILISISLAFLLLLIGFYRLHQIISIRLLTKHIDYYESQQLNQLFFVIATPYFEGVILILISALAIADQVMVSSLLLYLIVLTNCILNIGLSIIMHRSYFLIKSGFTLYSRDEQGVKQKIS